MYDGNDQISRIPIFDPYECKAHDIGADRSAYAPEAMEPAHVLSLIMQGNVIVQYGIHAARAESVGNCPEDQHPEAGADGKAEQRDRRQKNADRRDFPGAEFSDHSVAEEAGDNRTDGHDDGNDSRVRHRDGQRFLHDGPCRAEQGIGQTETDKADVDESE